MEEMGPGVGRGPDYYGLWARRTTDEPPTNTAEPPASTAEPAGPGAYAARGSATQRVKLIAQ